jgi:GcrA cell cycle regulator
MNWTEERVEILKKHLAEGLSASAIGRELGVTRNAIIGKVHRLKVPFLNPPGGNQERSKAPKPARAHGFRRPKAMTNSKAPGVMDLEPETVANPVTFLDLREHHCRWPVDGAGYETLFCGADHVKGFPYCIRHCRIAYRPPEPRRSRAEREAELRKAIGTKAA